MNVLRSRAPLLLASAACAASGALPACGARSNLFAPAAEKEVPEDAGADARAPVPPRDAGLPDSAPSCAVNRARVFLTSALFNANLGGVSGADADCEASAQKAGLGGTWRAWLSDSTTAASAHVFDAPGGYALLDGTVVAPSFAALVSGTLAHAIDLTESSAPIRDGNTEVWTGTALPSGGFAGGGFCADGQRRDWSSSAASAPTAFVGHSNATGPDWTDVYLQFCNRTNVRLYCFEVCE